MNGTHQSKIHDSKSWILSIQHFTSSNRLGKANNQSEEQQKKQIQYVVASTFDNWLSLKYIDVQKKKWVKLWDMKMTMPVVKSFIEFNQSFKPQGIVLAYFDGSLDYCPWSEIQKYYCLQIQAIKKRKISKTLPLVIQQTRRFAFINTIFDNSITVEQAFMLETICFLHKKDDFIYALNFKGELKILEVVENYRKIKLIQKIDLGCRILKAECLIKSKTSSIKNIVIAICFQNTSTPFVVEISSSTTNDKLLNKLKIFCKKLSESEDKQIKTQTKLMVYDPSNKLIITCTQSNEIGIFSFEHEQFGQKDLIYTAYLQKLFSVNYKEKVFLINDIDVMDDKLVILCKKSFYLYDIKEDFMITKGQKLNKQLQIGKFVSLTSEQGKPWFLVKKMFDYSNPEERKSTTLHLFWGE